MSFYNLIFGENPASDVLLATLGLSRDDVGRFRDCFVSDGKIVVYTRNGGGNRECWHLDEPEYGNPNCKHHVILKEVDEKICVPVDEAHKYPIQYNFFYSNGTQLVGTGKRVTKEYYYCEEPDSENCACPGCIIEYRLPKHPNYLYDEDDDFDSTYATIYFSFPEEFAKELEMLDSGEKFDPSQRWLKMLETLKKGA